VRVPLPDVLMVMPALWQVLNGSPFWFSRDIDDVAKALQSMCVNMEFTQQIQLLRMTQLHDSKYLDNVAKANKTRAHVLQNLVEVFDSVGEADINSMVNLDKGFNFYHPFHVGLRLTKIVPLMVFKSNARPLLLEFMTHLPGRHKPQFSGFPVILKKGDDLRLDTSCQQIFQMFNMFWRGEGLSFGDVPVVAHGYGVMTLSEDLGLIEYITGCAPMTHVDKISFTPHMRPNLVASAVAAFVAGYVLGVCDRHSDNIMISKKDGNLFHIDFGHILGDRVSIDTGDFPITPGLKAALGDYWEAFVGLSAKAFEILRENHQSIIQYAEFILGARDIELTGKVRAHLRKTLKLDRTTKQAVDSVTRKIQKAPGSYQTWLKNRIHAMNT